MPDLTPDDRDRLRELAENATPGPWMLDRDQRDGWMVVFGGNEYPHGYNIIGSNEYLEPADAEFIAASRQAMPALLDMLGQALAERDHARAQVDRVRELHQPIEFPGQGRFCDTCTTTWPCPTVRALDGES